MYPRAKKAEPVVISRRDTPIDRERREMSKRDESAFRGATISFAKRTVFGFGIRCVIAVTC